MFCHLTRWMISRAADTGRKTPRPAARHAARCRACREFAVFTDSLPARFARETPAFLAEVPDFSPKLVPPPAESARRRLVLRPLPAAAVLIVLVSAFVFFLVVRREPSLTIAEQKAALAGLTSVTALPDEFPGVVARAESPLVQERLILEKSVLSAVEFLGTRLNIRIERKPGSKTI